MLLFRFIFSFLGTTGKRYFIDGHSCDCMIPLAPIAYHLHRCQFKRTGGQFDPRPLQLEG
eukprot:5982211-Amphidinium_carterae.1